MNNNTQGFNTTFDSSIMKYASMDRNKLGTANAAHRTHMYSDVNKSMDI